MPAVLQAALPSTPLNDEFTTSTNETVPASWWWKLDIGATGTWNIVGDLAQVGGTAADKVRFSQAAEQ